MGLPRSRAKLSAFAAYAVGWLPVNNSDNAPPWCGCQASPKRKNLQIKVEIFIDFCSN